MMDMMDMNGYIYIYMDILMDDMTIWWLKNTNYIHPYIIFIHILIILPFGSIFVYPVAMLSTGQLAMAEKQLRPR